MALRKRHVKTRCGTYTLVPDKSDPYQDVYDVKSSAGTHIGRIEEGVPSDPGDWVVLGPDGRYKGDVDTPTEGAKKLCGLPKR